MKDKKLFKTLMVKMSCVFYNTEKVSSIKADAYWEALRDCRDKECGIAINRLIKKEKFHPSPAVIREEIGLYRRVERAKKKSQYDIEIEEDMKKWYKQS